MNWWTGLHLKTTFIIRSQYSLVVNQALCEVEIPGWEGKTTNQRVEAFMTVDRRSFLSKIRGELLKRFTVEEVDQIEALASIVVGGRSQIFPTSKG